MNINACAQTLQLPIDMCRSNQIENVLCHVIVCIQIENIRVVIFKAMVNDENVDFVSSWQNDIRTAKMFEKSM